MGFNYVCACLGAMFYCPLVHINMVWRAICRVTVNLISHSCFIQFRIWLLSAKAEKQIAPQLALERDFNADQRVANTFYSLLFFLFFRWWMEYPVCSSTATQHRPVNFFRERIEIECSCPKFQQHVLKWNSTVYINNKIRSEEKKKWNRNVCF